MTLDNGYYKKVILNAPGGIKVEILTQIPPNVGDKILVGATTYTVSERRFAEGFKGYWDLNVTATV